MQNTPNAIYFSPQNYLSIHGVIIPHLCQILYINKGLIGCFKDGGKSRFAAKNTLKKTGCVADKKATHPLFLLQKINFWQLQTRSVQRGR